MTKRSIAVRGREGSLRLVSADEILAEMKDTYDAIARRAFEIFEGNGRRFGRAADDWFQAEAELLHILHLEILETDSALKVKAEVPGFAEEEIEINVEARRLAISGKRHSAAEGRNGTAVYSERCSNRIFRVVDLPAEVDTTSSAVKAEYDKGVLTITLPKLGKLPARPTGTRAKPVVK